MKREESNKLIAIFMGAKSCDRCEDCGMVKIGQDYQMLEFMRYDKSWDWLMPVVEKIEALKTEKYGYIGISINSNGCTAYSIKRKGNLPIYFNDHTDTKLSATYQVVIEFINHYNTVLCPATPN